VYYPERDLSSLLNQLFDSPQGIVIYLVKQMDRHTMETLYAERWLVSWKSIFIFDFDNILDHYYDE
jgi:hypothetical protein